MITITVTISHIQNGHRHSNTKDPIALALREATAEPWQVTTEGAWPSGADNEPMVILPPNVLRFIRDWDAGKSGCLPFTFEIDHDPHAPSNQRITKETLHILIMSWL